MPTIFDAFASPAIAAYYEESHYNKMEYLGKTLFPATRNPSMDLKWLKGSFGLPVELKASTLGSKAEIRDRVGFEKMEVEMPFFREAMQIDERDRQQLLTLNASPESGMAEMYINKIYDDSGQLIVSSDVSAEKMRMQLLSTGIIGVDINGKELDYDYGLPAENKVTLVGADMWTDATADVLGQIETWQDTIEEASGERPSRALVNSFTFKLLRANNGIKIKAYPDKDPSLVSLTDAEVKKVLETNLDLTIMIYSKKYQNKAGTATKYYPDYKFTLLPSTAIGKTHYAPSPEEADQMALGKVADVTIVNNGVAVTSITIPHPVNREVIVSAIMLPSGENLDKILIATVGA